MTTHGVGFGGKTVWNWTRAQPCHRAKCGNIGSESSNLGFKILCNQHIIKFRQNFVFVAIKWFYPTVNLAFWKTRFSLDVLPLTPSLRQPISMQTLDLWCCATTLHVNICRSKDSLVTSSVRQVTASEVAPTTDLAPGRTRNFYATRPWGHFDSFTKPRQDQVTETN